jgi:hypothetical protein
MASGCETLRRDRGRSTIGGGDRWIKRDELLDLVMSRKFRIFVENAIHSVLYIYSPRALSDVQSMQNYYPRYRDYGLSIHEKAQLLYKRRQEAVDRERERLRVLSEPVPVVRAAPPRALSQLSRWTNSPSHPSAFPSATLSPTKGSWRLQGS